MFFLLIIVKQIIDGGSTGSRLHIFEFVPRNNSTATANNNNNNNNKAAVDCMRRGSARANVPLSAFGRTEEQIDAGHVLDAQAVAAHLLPAFEEAARIVPARYHSSTRVRYQATAGMRLLPLSEQEEVYDAMYDGLLAEDTFVFRGLQRSDIATLSGSLEGFYGAVAANYLKGMVDANMELSTTTTQTTPVSVSSSSNGDDDPVGPLGALDMGGSSTQIVFLSNPEQSQQTEVLEESNSLDEDDFFSTSYLSYGVDQIRERLWNKLVSRRRRKQQQQQQHSIEYSDFSFANDMIENPCANKGYQVDWKGYTLVGTGDAEQCVALLQRLIPYPERHHHRNTKGNNIHNNNKMVGGISHPPVKGKFLAMSLYFFSLDSLRELSGDAALSASWPTPSIHELANALPALCGRSWEDDLVHIQDNAHAFTRPAVLPHRCFESCYMVSLLRDGFGFAPQSRDITFTFTVDGSEVEWSLGLALATRAQQQQQQQAQAQQHQVVVQDEIDSDINSVFESKPTTPHRRSMPASHRRKRNATRSRTIHPGHTWMEMYGSTLSALQ